MAMCSVESRNQWLRGSSSKEYDYRVAPLFYEMVKVSVSLIPRVVGFETAEQVEKAVKKALKKEAQNER